MKLTVQPLKQNRTEQNIPLKKDDQDRYTNIQERGNKYFFSYKPLINLEKLHHTIYNIK